MSTKKEDAKWVIEHYGKETAYFDKSVKYSDMYLMFRDRFNFGVAETEVILAALILAGAKFKEE
jgi:hypothetical protein